MHKTEEQCYQAVIIGAGPSGAACAISLQKLGISNCLIEKASFPRHKTCGGLVTAKTHKQLQLLFGEDPVPEDLFCDKTKEITVYEKRKPLAHTSVMHAFRFVNRETFDHALVSYYEAKGGRVLQGETTYQIDHENKRVTFPDGRCLFWKYLVYADGIFSQAHRDFPLKKREQAFGLEAFLPAGALQQTGVGLHFGFIPNGYVWVFPAGERICIGMGNLCRKGYPYREEFQKVLKTFGITPEKDSFHGAFFPYGNTYPQKHLPPDVLLAGDAAGLADPISGEGLYYALLSGREAAMAFLTENPAASYRKAVKPVYRQIKEGKRLQKVFFKPFMQKHFLRLIKERNRFLKFYMDEHVSFCRYSHGQLFSMIRAYKRQKKSSVIS